MGKIVCLMGKSATGKDTIFQELLSNPDLQLNVIVTYTTRPRRAEEEEGQEYHFVDEAEFQKLKKEGRVIEDREYHTCHGLWRYFMVDDRSIEVDSKNYLVIGTIESYIKCREYFGEKNLLPILIELDDGVRLQRALDREKVQECPRYEEMCRRFLADSVDFSEEKIREAKIDRRFQNNNLRECIKEISNYIKSQL